MIHISLYLGKCPCLSFPFFFFFPPHNKIAVFSFILHHSYYSLDLESLPKHSCVEGMVPKTTRLKDGAFRQLLDQEGSTSVDQSLMAEWTTGMLDKLEEVGPWGYSLEGFISLRVSLPLPVCKELCSFPLPYPFTMMSLL